MRNILAFASFLFLLQVANAQPKTKLLLPGEACIILDTLVVRPTSIHALNLTTNTTVEFQFLSNSNSFFRLCCFSDTLRISYEVFDLKVNYQKYDWSATKPDKFTFTTIQHRSKENYTDQIQKFGSISRSISTGNQQNIGAQSALNLQLKGKLANRFQLVASISDNQLPIQASGTTQQVQEIDQVFIQLSDEKSKWIAGDFALSTQANYFMKFNKRGLGLYVNSNETFNKKELKTETSVSISKGKFNRLAIQGLEGVQGPYRLQGANGERFVTVLAGTEVVYIDGKKLIRGLDQDYAIDYNTAEIVFTSKQRITKDKRIVVEFQYVDRQYLRPLITQQTEFSFGNGGKFYSQLFLESDVKNQPLSQPLNLTERETLYNAGNSITNTFISAIDSLGFDPNQIRYDLVDSLGIDSILVYSTNALIAHYSAVFTFVGIGNGNYIESAISPFGKVYKWVAPVGGIPQGSYEPIRKLTPPNRQLMWVLGLTNERIFNQWKGKIRTEAAFSQNDLNTFSSIGNQINLGGAGLFEGKLINDKENRSHQWECKAEYLSSQFKRIERFREVEFERNWNLLTLPVLNTSQLNAQLGYGFQSKKHGNMLLQLGVLELGNAYLGKKVTYKQHVIIAKRMHVIADAWALQTQGVIKSKFLRQKLHVYHDGKKIVTGFKDEQEYNNANTGTNAYAFFDGELYVRSQDTTSRMIKFFVRNRTDQRILNDALTPLASAWNGGLELKGKTAKGTQINLILNQRNLQVLDTSSTLIPLNTTLGRIEFRTASQKLIQLNLFYETGSGLSPIQAYVYAEVPLGQGVYVWNDYNENGVKELEEFEVSAFSYEANYIRIPIQTTEYQNVFTSGLTTSLNIQFSNKKVWRNEGFKKFLQPWALSLQNRSESKTNQSEYRLYPIAVMNDSIWLGYTNAQRGGIYFNRGNPRFSADLIFTRNENKSQLLSGFESKEDRSGQLTARTTLKSFWNLLCAVDYGKKLSASNFLSIRNYAYSFTTIKPALIFQPTAKKQFGLNSEFGLKNGGDAEARFESTSLSISSLIQWEISEGQLFKTEIKWTSIALNGSLTGSALYDALNGLQVGNNMQYQVDWRKFINENLQLSLQYNGRKSEARPMVHAGSMSIRMLFN